MTADDTLRALCDLVGVFPEFVDLDGVTRPIAPETQIALLRADGLAVSTAQEIAETLAELRAVAADAFLPDDVVISCDSPATLQPKGSPDWHVIADDSDRVLAEGRTEEGRIELPSLPAGVHQLHLQDGVRTQEMCLIAAPAGAPALADMGAGQNSWGVVAALYGLHSARNAGPGDFADLADLAQGLGAQGAGFLGINPVHATGWADEGTISPYSPTHRGFLNTNHIAPQDLPGVTARAGNGAVNGLIDYPAHRSWHRAALRAARAEFDARAPSEDRAAFAAFCDAGGQALQEFALFEALSENHGPDWRHWPAALQTPGRAATAAATDTGFHLWLQWIADQQLGRAQARAREAGMPLGLYLDLAVGSRRGGAEAWSAQNAVAEAVSVGAPPDQLSPAGQNWQLAGFAPRKLRAARYAPFRQVLAQSMRHAGLMRIDHVLGLNRSFWIPDDGSPGGYIRQPFGALLAIAAIEAQRAGTAVVGEDLGLVPPGFREEMAGRGFYGYTVLQYEKTGATSFRNPADLRPQSLACFGTHDTPTLRGYWSGHDIDWWQELGWIDPDEVPAARARREEEKAALPGTGDESGVRDAVHEALAGGATAMVAVQLDDVLDVREAQNLPGTTHEHPNWQRRYPLPVPQITTDARLAATARIMARAGRVPAEKD